MFRRSTTLSVPQPCFESWASMTPRPQGRHCASCQEVVVDFTEKTDAEILAFLKQYPKVSCGRFTEDQLDRPLQGNQPPRPRWTNWLAALLTVWGAGQLAAPTVRGQNMENRAGGGPQPLGGGAGQLPRSAPVVAGTAPAPPAERTDNLPEEADASAADSLQVSGVVCNRWGIPLRNAVIRLGNQELTRTDITGYFQVTLPADSLQQAQELRINRFHYRGQVLAINPDRHRPYALFLKRRPNFRKLAGKFR
ncbi:hypothetical protein LJY25_05195 [Hymenobacter sp. BT175]|uniref:hypothetical protein n=1 Tax=Hymenobacter translucens TaxID=2886507 RepID=UPI001D0F04C7|nr:hypothetical protein [Hymenobacter translucens]MCC2545830.1 hypothetical protein [Hymenobacter translucens]